MWHRRNNSKSFSLTRCQQDVEPVSPLVPVIQPYNSPEGNRIILDLCCFRRVKQLPKFLSPALSFPFATIWPLSSQSCHSWSPWASCSDSSSAAGLAISRKILLHYISIPEKGVRPNCEPKLHPWFQVYYNLAYIFYFPGVSKHSLVKERFWVG